MTDTIKRLFAPSSLIRRFIGSWLFAAAVEYILVDTQLKNLGTLSVLAEMSFLRVVIVTAVIFTVLCGLSVKKDRRIIERVLITAAFGALATATLITSFTLPYLFFCLVILSLCVVYAILGSDKEEPVPAQIETRTSKLWLTVTVGVAVLFGFTVSAWTVCRVLAYLTPTYDFGIFAQMFENMRNTGIPVTTLERVEAISHFKVHVSPVYYLLLPFYVLLPRPETLQILQAAVLASAVIPMWKIAKHHGLSPFMRTLCCALLLFYPAVAGGTSYDLHENCFLTPLVLWLLYGMDKMSIPIISVSALLTLTVKEDAAVYVAVAALWLIIRSLVRDKKNKRRAIICGTVMLLFSIAYFICTTSYLVRFGDGVMTGRYKNFLYDGSDSLFTVIKAVILSPMKAVFECADPEKLKFILFTLLPLLGLPLFTRRYDRFILLIPYILLNLMSDYPYQHSIFFQYTFASSAFLIYLTVVNLADIKIAGIYKERVKTLVLAGCVVTSAVFFSALIIPKASRTVSYFLRNADYFSEQTANLEAIPDDASVAATGYYTTKLSNHEVLYDVYYATREQLFSCEYVVLDKGLTGDYRKFAKNAQKGYDALAELLYESDYEVMHEAKHMVIYKKVR